MRNIIVGLIATVFAAGAVAQSHRHNHHHHHGRNWVAPAAIGLIVGAAIASANAQAQGQTQPPVVVDPRTAYPYPIQPPVVVPSQGRRFLRAIDVYIPECNCYRTFNYYVYE